jgi:hypothetical protein
MMAYINAAFVLFLFLDIFAQSFVIRPPNSDFVFRAEADAVLSSNSLSLDPTSFCQDAYDFIIVGGG